MTKQITRFLITIVYQVNLWDLSNDLCLTLQGVITAVQLHYWGNWEVLNAEWWRLNQITSGGSLINMFQEPTNLLLIKGNVRTLVIDILNNCIYMPWFNSIFHELIVALKQLFFHLIWLQYMYFLPLGHFRK